MTEKDACIALNLLSGIGASRFKALRSHFGAATKALEASFEELRIVPGFGDGIAAEVSSWKEKARLEEELALCERGGVKIITLLEKEYPQQLLELADPPLCLYVRGTLDVSYVSTLAVVGSRRTTSYGRQMAEFITGAAAYAGWTIVSGLALGIDTVAHRTAINSKGKTVAVLGGGLARIFPQENVPLANEIINSGGAVVSEFPMNFPPNRQSFPMRNRIVSGVSRGTLVVEAGAKSGALITAQFALEQGRSVFAVPGRADSPQSKGCHSIIKQGAKLTESFDDIIEDFEYLPGLSAAGRSKAKASLSCGIAGEGQPLLQTHNQADGFSEEEKKIVELLSAEGEMAIDTISMRVNMQAGKLLSALSRLEIRKVVIQSTGKRFSIPIH